MSRAFIKSFCESFPGAELTDPWGTDKDGNGHDVWKIGGKMFAAMGVKTDGVSVKTDSVETAQMLIDVRVGCKAAYMHKSWVNLPFDTDEEELRHRIKASYKIIRSGLTRKAQNALPPFDDPFE